MQRGDFHDLKTQPLTQNRRSLQEVSSEMITQSESCTVKTLTFDHNLITIGA